MALMAAQDICNLHAPPHQFPPIKHELPWTGFYYYHATVKQLHLPKTMTLCNYEASILFDWPMPVLFLFFNRLEVHLWKEGPEETAKAFSVFKMYFSFVVCL